MQNMNNLKDPPKGLFYDKVYDLNTGKIKDKNYVKLLDKVWQELKNIGLDVRPYYAKE